MAENVQQFGTQVPYSTTSSREVSEIRAKVSELSSLVKQVFAARQQHQEPAEVSYTSNQQGGRMYSYNHWGGQANQGRSSSGMPLEDIVKQLADPNAQIQCTQKQFIQSTTSHI